jgi:putative aminopeptidase FrvX
MFKEKITTNLSENNARFRYNLAIIRPPTTKAHKMLKMGNGWCTITITITMTTTTTHLQTLTIKSVDFQKQLLDSSLQSNDLCDTTLIIKNNKIGQLFDKKPIGFVILCTDSKLSDS